MNKVILTGRITKDPEIRYSSNGQTSLRFSLAVDRQGPRDANGNRQADFVSCVAFSQRADFISRYVKKGNMLAIEGRIQTGQYQDQTGATHYTTDVIVDQVENLTPRDPNAQPNMQQPMGGYQQPSYQQPSYQQPVNNYQPQGYNNPTYGSQPMNQKVEQQPQSFELNTDNSDDLPF